jgi:hypothetical protein
MGGSAGSAAGSPIPLRTFGAGASDDEDRHGPLRKAHVAVDHFVHDLAQHEGDEEVERGEVPDGPVSEDPDDREDEDVNGEPRSAVIRSSGRPSLLL